MATFEASGPCSLGEYEAWEQYRLQGQQLVVGEEYMFMMRLKRMVAGRQAGKHLTRLTQIHPSDSSVYTVRFDLIHDATKHSVVDNLQFDLHDGRIDLFATSLTTDILKTPLTGGYFRGDFEMGDGTALSEQLAGTLPQLV
ncbi:hypothetical protein KC973_03705 [Candidatus Saccharibacteria bacterium]|nr:hypothetical protein [Candidatus Saccharibacteria bacterium]